MIQHLFSVVLLKIFNFHLHIMYQLFIDIVFTLSIPFPYIEQIEGLTQDCSISIANAPVTHQISGMICT